MQVYFDRFTLKLTRAQARQGSHPGNCDGDIDELLNDEGIKAQLDALNPSDIAKELAEFGAWDEEELRDHERNVRRILWIACGNAADEDEPIQWTKITHDTNGNPRYVCHYLNLLTQKELDAQEGLMHPWKYAVAVERSHKWGGRKFHNKQYGGGIVFSTYSLGDLEKTIKAYLEKVEES